MSSAPILHRRTQQFNADRVNVKLDNYCCTLSLCNVSLLLSGTRKCELHARSHCRNQTQWKLHTYVICEGNKTIKTKMYVFAHTNVFTVRCTIAIACCPSVRPSVCNVIRSGSNRLEILETIITRAISPTPSLFGAQRPST